MQLEVGAVVEGKITGIVSFLCCIIKIKKGEGIYEGFNCILVEDKERMDCKEASFAHALLWGEAKNTYGSF